MPPPAPTLPIEERTGQALESPSGSPGKRRNRQGRGGGTGGRWHRANSDITPTVGVDCATPTPYPDARWYGSFALGGMPMPMLPPHPGMPFPGPGYFPPPMFPADPSIDPNDIPKEVSRMWPNTPTPGGAGAHMYNGFWLNPTERMASAGEAPQALQLQSVPDSRSEDEQSRAQSMEEGGGNRWNVKNTFVHIPDDDGTPVALQPKGQSMPDMMLQTPGRTTPSRSVGGPPMQSIPEPTQEQVDDERLAIPVECPEGMPSRGSAIHGTGKCRPCAWFHKAQGCQNYQQCAYCHICPEGELKQRKKAKVAAMRMGALEPANKEISNVAPRVLKLGPLLS